MAKTAMHYADGLPFVLYRKPNFNDINGLFQDDAALHFCDDFTEEGFVFAPFDSHKPAVLMLKDAMLNATDFSAIDKSADRTCPLTPDLGQRQFHIELVKKGKTAISNAVFKKVVLSRQLEANTDKNPFDLFVGLLSSYDNAFCYLWFHPKVGLWLGATPEILLKTENNKFTTMSLAGTRVYTDENAEPWGNKERSEQDLVTQYIARALEGKIPKLTISEVESVRAGNLEHLRTKITGDFQGNLMEIVKALHPTPAVCGMPMQPARNFILENEPDDREFYTGFLGELNIKSTKERATDRKNQENLVYKAVKSRTILWVNLRCMQLVADNVIIYVGGGITKDSIPESEWQETEEKSKTMLRILQLP